MPSSGFNAVIAPRARNLNVIWFAFLAAPFLYTIVGWVATRGGRPATGIDVPVGLLQVVLLLAATVLTLASYVYPRRALAEARLRRLLAGPFPGQPPAGMADLEPVEQRLVLLFPHYQTTQIVSLAMREAIAIFGLVLAIVTGSFLMMVPWSIVAVGLISSQPPRSAEFLAGAMGLARSAGAARRG